MTETTILSLAAYAAAGAALGAVYFFLLHRTVQLLTAGGPAWMSAAFSLTRYALAVAVFWGVVQAGAAALVAALVGFMAARLAAHRIVRIG